jgi:flagellar biosynthesis/type III secretory pathway M-ring protein FliF/YscJ
LISPAVATTVSPVTQQPKAVSAIKTPDRETSTTAVASDTHDSYARLLVSLIVLGVVVIAMIAIVGVVMEIRRRKQQKNAQADDEYFYDEADDVLDGYDNSQNWTFDSDRTPRAYL